MLGDVIRVQKCVWDRCTSSLMVERRGPKGLGGCIVHRDQCLGHARSSGQVSGGSGRSGASGKVSTLYRAIHSYRQLHKL